MNSVKLGTLVIASMFAMNSFAQSKRVEKQAQVERPAKAQLTPEQKATQQTEKLNEKLNLTEAQRSEIYNINYNVNLKNQVVRDSDVNTKEFKKASYEGNNKSRMYLIRETLTTEQKVIWDKMIAEKAAKESERKESHEGHDHDGHSHH